MFKRLTMIPLILMMLVTFVFSGCSIVTNPQLQQYALDSTDFAVQVSVFKKQYAQVEELMRTKQAEQAVFNDDEWRKLLNVDASIDMLMMKADAIIQLNPDSVSLADVEMMYNMAKAGYSQAYAVISGKWAELDPSTQILLEALDREAKLVDEKIVKLKDDPTNANITKTLTLITGVLGIAVKMLGAAVL